MTMSARVLSRVSLFGSSIQVRESLNRRLARHRICPVEVESIGRRKL